MQTDTPLISDQVRRFILEQRPVRGQWVHLDSAWRELRAHASYPTPVNELLGQAVAAVVLLSATLKFRGTLTFQLQGTGAVNLLVAQCTHDFHLRAVARWDATALALLKAGEPFGTVFHELVGADGRVTVTIESEDKSTRYQGIVPLAGQVSSPFRGSGRAEVSSATNCIFVSLFNPSALKFSADTPNVFCTSGVQTACVGFKVEEPPELFGLAVCATPTCPRRTPPAITTPQSVHNLTTDLTVPPIP